ncbi:MAG: CopD family protein [Burkholderiaceae bacterium]
MEEPRLLLGILITLHILALAFWIGAFGPLYRLANDSADSTAGLVAHDFGRLAIWVVGLLTVVGIATLWLLTGGTSDAVFSPYGQFFAIKLILFLAIVSLAALNKLRLTPALLRAEPGAGARLRQSIGLEAALVMAILLTTATLTTISVPAGAAWTARG